jgi:hypothetical protein
MICPLLGKCDAKIPLETYQALCTSLTEDAYKKCEQFKKLAGGSKSPADWERLLRPTV